MRQPPQKMLIRWFCHLYGMLLYTYPADFRRQYAEEMAQLVRDRCRDLVETRGVHGLLRFAAQLAADWLTTAAKERMCSMWTSNRSQIRLALLTGLGASLLMMAAKVWRYRPLLAMPGGWTFVIETAGLLVLYALLVAWATKSDGPLSNDVLLSCTLMGVIGGVIQIAHLTQEEFADLGPVWNGVSAFGLLFCTFVVWGIAGYRASRRTGSLRSGALAGVWSAAVTMSMLILFGFVVEFYLAMPKPEYVATWGEFQRSGWTDIHAFTIANTLDAAQSHLIIGPIVGGIFGGLAGAITRIRGRQEPRAMLGSS